jgi:hypothetical protein
MGAWDELDTLIEATSDVSALDDLIEVCNSDSDFAEIFEPAVQQAEAWKTAIEEGTEQGLEVTAENLVSMEQTEILDTGKHPYAQGILGTSIRKEEHGNGWLVGTSITHIYPMSVEYGADIFPLRAKALAFQPDLNVWDGEVNEKGFVFLPYAHISPRPFVAPAYERMVSKIEGEGYGVFRSVCDKMTQAIIN